MRCCPDALLRPKITTPLALGVMVQSYCRGVARINSLAQSRSVSQRKRGLLRHNPECSWSQVKLRGVCCVRDRIEASDTIKQALQPTYTPKRMVESSSLVNLAPMAAIARYPTRLIPRIGKPMPFDTWRTGAEDHCAPRNLAGRKEDTDFVAIQLELSLGT